MALNVGDAAPDFNLKTAIGEEQGEFKLSNHQGRRVVIIFYALDFTPVCQHELAVFQEHFQEFAELNADVVGICTDTVFSHIAFQQALGSLKFPLAADRWPYAATAQAYGLFPPTRHEIPFVNDRAVFIVDKNGKVAWSKIYALRDSPDVKEVLSALANIT
jgi:peroxiredoxin